MPDDTSMRPSSAENIELCPRWEPSESRDTSAADEGTLLHEAVETGDWESLPPELQPLALSAIRFTESVMAGHPEGEDMSELKLRIPDLIKGTADRVITNKTKSRADLIDYKFGRVRVTHPSENTQVQAYVAMLLRTFPTLQSVRAHILAPRQPGPPENHLYTRDDYPRLVLKLETIGARRRDPERPFTPNEHSCRWCGAKGKCPALHEYVLQVGEALPVPAAAGDWALDTPENAAHILTVGALVEDWLKQKRKHYAARVVEDGWVIPGFGIRFRSGAMKITDPYGAVQMLLRNEDLDLDKIMGTATMSLSKLVDLVVAEKGGTKKEARARLEEQLAPCLAQEPEVRFLQREARK